MKDLQVASSACELREDGQAGTDVAILGFLPSSRRSHYGGAAGRFHVANCPRLSRPGKVLPLCFFCCLASVPSMEEQQAGSSAGELHGAEQAREKCCNSELFVVLAEVPIMEERQATSSAGELHEVEQAGEGVAILGFLLSR